MVEISIELFKFYQDPLIQDAHIGYPCALMLFIGIMAAHYKRFSWRAAIASAAWTISIYILVAGGIFSYRMRDLFAMLVESEPSSGVKAIVA